MTTTPKHPEVHVQLSGVDGNAFIIIGACTRAARRAKVDADEIKAFVDEAMDGDYDNLLRVCLRWWDCD